MTMTGPGTGESVDFMPVNPDEVIPEGETFAQGDDQIHQMMQRLLSGTNGG
jgi:hypothetical protein